MDPIVALLESISAEPYNPVVHDVERRATVRDYVQGLPVELQEHVLSFYNWNEIYIPRFVFLMDRTEALLMNRHDRIYEDVWILIDRLKWWVHLFMMEPANRNLIGDGRSILDRLQRVGAYYDLSEQFELILDYNFGPA